MSGSPNQLAQAEGLLTVQRIALDQPLRPDLYAWLGRCQPHPIFATADWYGKLAEFERGAHSTHRHHQYFWLIVLRDGLPFLGAPMEQAPPRMGRPHLRLLTNYYSPMVGLFFDADTMVDEQAWRTLSWGIDQLFPNWLMLHLLPLTEDQRLQLDAAMGHIPHGTFPYIASANYTAHFSSLTDYWAKRPSKLLHTLKRKRKRLQAQSHRFEVLRRPTQDQIEQYWNIYRSSWKVQEPSRCFIDWLLDTTATHDQLRLGFLYVDNKVVACHLWLVNGQTASIFKLAQDSSADQFSPGSLLTEHMINTVVTEDDIRTIDFLLGADPFKAMWMDGQQFVWGMEVVNRRTIAGRLLTRYYRIKASVKSILHGRARP
jgi:hypothetical protein